MSGPCTRLGDLLAEVEAFVRRYVVLPGDSEAAAFALWIAHTYAIEAAHATPYLLVVSPEKRSGKTRVQEIAELLAAGAWRVTGASEAAIYRRIGQERPTLLLDEIDAVFGSPSERTEPLRAILNAGNRPGAVVSRCVGPKGDQVRDFDVYCAKCLAGIDRGDRIPDTIRDRAITIAMRRRTPDEQLARLRWRYAEADAAPLRAMLARWASMASEALLAAEPHIPAELDDRAADAWEPLLAIADSAGSRWPQRARNAAVALSAGTDRDEHSTGTVLLAAIRVAFSGADRLSTSALLAKLNGDEELPFGGFRDGRGLDGRRLARMLRPYGVRPRTIRLDDGGTPKGYLSEQFADVWARWLPHGQAPHAQQAPHGATRKHLRQAVVADVADAADAPGSLALPPLPGDDPRWDG